MIPHIGYVLYTSHNYAIVLSYKDNIRKLYYCTPDKTLNFGYIGEKYCKYVYFEVEEASKGTTSSVEQYQEQNNIEISNITSLYDIITDKRTDIEISILGGSITGSVNGFDLRDNPLSSCELTILEYLLLIWHERSLYDTLNDKYSNLKNVVDIVNGTDIQHILDSIQIEISEIFLSRPGKDDCYYVDKTVSIDNSMKNKIDDWLYTDFLKIGSTNIYSDSGYTDCYSLRLEKLEIGVLSGENLQREIDDLKKQYSKEIHLKGLINRSILSIQRINESLLECRIILKGYDKSMSPIIGDISNDYCKNKLDKIKVLSSDYNCFFESILKSTLLDK